MGSVELKPGDSYKLGGIMTRGEQFCSRGATHDEIVVMCNFFSFKVVQDYIQALEGKCMGTGLLEARKEFRKIFHEDLKKMQEQREVYVGQEDFGYRVYDYSPLYDLVYISHKSLMRKEVPRKDWHGTKPDVPLSTSQISSLESSMIDDWPSTVIVE